MAKFSSSAEFATVAEGIDNYEISDGRLKFKDGGSGIITAKFMVTEDETWRKLRLTYRQPGKGLRSENYVIARLNKIDRMTLGSETLIVASSQNHDTDSDDIRSMTGAKTLTGKFDFSNFFYHIEVVMRRSTLFMVPADQVVEAMPFIGAPTSESQEHPTTECDEPDENEMAPGPSIPIPPPSPFEIATIKFHRETSAFFHPGERFLTPSPELILVQLSTASTGF